MKILRRVESATGSVRGSIIRRCCGGQGQEAGSELAMTVVRVRLARAVAFLSIGLLAVGCTAVTGGKAQAPPRLMPRSLTGQTIRQVLLDGETLSRILKEPFII